jgi:hypothetical protein
MLAALILFLIGIFLILVSPIFDERRLAMAPRRSRER